MATETTKSVRGEATRRRIVEQSAAVFNQHGYSGTSMSELMTVTGLEKGGIYRHFESKQELAAEAFDYAWAMVNEPRWRGLEDCETSLEKLLLLVKNFVEPPPRALPGGCPLLNTAIDSDDGNPVLRSKVRGALDQWRSSIAEIVRTGQRSRELRRDPRRGRHSGHCHPGRSGHDVANGTNARTAGYGRQAPGRIP
jgi:TetR/AcrR family transcriptional repressor of nem operon